MRKILMFATLLFGLVTSGATASASDTWLPDFDQNTHVYVDAKLANRITLSNDFQTKVQEKASVKGLSTYIVVTQEGDELSGSSREDWAPKILHGRLWDRWRYQTGFSEDRILIILYVRAKDADSGSIAVRSGSYLHGIGLDRDHFASSSGPVMPTAKQFMRTDPQTGLLTILDNINAEIAAGGVTAASPWLFGWPGWVWIVIIIVVILLIIMLLAKASSSGGSGGGWFVGGGCGGGGGGGGGCGGGGCGGGGGC